MIGLTRIISLLTERVIASGSWELTVAELETLADDPVVLYRAMYESRLIGRDTYEPACAGELVTLLERAGHVDAEARFRSAGLFLTHDDRVELIERFVRALKRAVVRHVPDVETFRSMITRLRRYDVALATYLDSYLAAGPVVHLCAREFTEDRGGGTVHFQVAVGYLTSLLDRRIVELEDLAPAFCELLRSVARDEGALPPLRTGAARFADGPHRDSARRNESEADARREARKLLAINTSRPSRAVIQAAYRRLMRRYHPDINPEGLEMTKNVNAAYALLLTSEDLP